MANDLASTSPIEADRFSPPALTTSLAAVVHSPAIWDDPHADLPVLTPTDCETARRALAIYEAMPTGSEPDHITKLMGSVSWMPQKEGGIERAKMQLAVYKTTLADIDADVLAAAFREAVQTLTFFPSVAELRAIAGRLPPPRRKVIAWRLRRLLLEARIGSAPVVDPVPAGNVAAVVARVDLAA